MTILIKGMEMPEGCRDCELGGVYIHRDANDVYTEEKYRCSVTFYPLKDLTKRHEKCPLVEVPAPHDRLIDAYAAIMLLQKYYDRERNVLKQHAIGECIMIIKDDAPTVIEAEK